MKLIAKEDFKWAHDHVRIVEYKAGEEIETDDEDLIAVSTAEGWTLPDGVDETPKRKARSSENKAEPGAPENKSN